MKIRPGLQVSRAALEAELIIVPDLIIRHGGGSASRGGRAVLGQVGPGIIAAAENLVAADIVANMGHALAEHIPGLGSRCLGAGVVSYRSGGSRE